MRPTVRVRFFPGRSAVSLSHSCVGPRIRIAGAQSKIARVRHNPLMRIHIGTDHAGFELKNHLKDHWRRAGHEVVDHGSHEYDPGDDYPEFCFACAEGVIADPGSLGVALGGSGNGEQIAANKVDGVRAALVWSVETARLARQHNDANVAGFGVRQHSVEEALTILDAFIAEPFSGDARHRARIDQVRDYERTHHEGV